MQEKLWAKGKEQLDKIIGDFEVGMDWQLDLVLAQYDVLASIAHVTMLKSIGVITDKELMQILAEYRTLYDLALKQQLVIKKEDEDIHTVLEHHMVEKLGDTGKKIHTARSRNDQVHVATRLYCKDKTIDIANATIELIDTLLQFAEEHENIPLPGYTHTQRAMPSSVAMWAGAFCEGLLDELKLLTAVYQYVDSNPLGSGAALGVPLQIDRQLTSDLLGFNRVQINSLYCAISRGKVESHITNSLTGIGFFLNKLATDLVFYTCADFGFFYADSAITTGSSLMPQKRNLDPMELVRAKYHQLIGIEVQIKSLISNLLSGYNRDYQETKKAIMEAFDIVESSLKVSNIVMQHIKPVKEKCMQGHSKEIFATDYVIELVNQGKPFRDAYREVGQNLDTIPDMDPVELLSRRKHIGATGNLQLHSYKESLQTVQKEWHQRQKDFHKTLQKLIKK